jgi:hypothetical protein
MSVDFDDSFGKGVRRFLRQMANAFDDPVRAFAGESQ